MTEIPFTLTGDFIELYKLLKLTGLCDSGGEAKYAVTQSLVKVDGQIELRKAAKIRRGARVEYYGQLILVQ